MSFLSSVIYGIIQGLTEFLPVSSSGHLSIAQNFFGAANIQGSYLTFDILLHLGTLCAVIGVYFADILELIKDFFEMIKDIITGHGARLSIPGRKMVVMIIVATLPLIFVLPIKDYIDSLYSNTIAIGIALIITGILLFTSDRFKGIKDIKRATITDSIIVGLFQAVATVPGISRSGATIAGGLMRGYKRDFAVKFSFIMSIPAVIGANILSIPQITAIPNNLVVPYIAGTIAAIISGIFAIKLISWLAKNSNFRIFAIYCTCVGVMTIIFTLIR